MTSNHFHVLIWINRWIVRDHSTWWWNAISHQTWLDTRRVISQRFPLQLCEMELPRFLFWTGGLPWKGILQEWLTCLRLSQSCHRGSCHMTSTPQRNVSHLPRHAAQSQWDLWRQEFPRIMIWKWLFHKHTIFKLLGIYHKKRHKNPDSTIWSCISLHNLRLPAVRYRESEIK